jgi:stage II sporulation protein D
MAALHLPSAWALSAAVLCAISGFSRIARGEPEVRILLEEGLTAVEVRGQSIRLAVDAEAPRPAPAVPVRLEARGGRLRFSAPLAGRTAERVVLTSAEPLEVHGIPYLGRIEVVRGTDGLVVLNRLPVETYLLGIVGSEMPAAWPVEALKAQAVAARTYALQRRLRRRAGGHAWDLTDSVISQVYRGAASIPPSVIEAVRATTGVVLTFDHEPAEALFHSTCGGHTQPSERVFGARLPYLERRECRWCRESTKYRWSLELDREEIGRLLERAGLARGFRRLERAGEEADVIVYDRRGRRAVDPERVRSAVGAARLYSTRFEVVRRGGALRLDGAGYGHRVGLCQWGARGMAAEGRTYREILDHYYDGAALKRAY